MSGSEQKPTLELWMTFMTNTHVQKTRRRILQAVALLVSTLILYLFDENYNFIPLTITEMFNLTLG